MMVPRSVFRHLSPRFSFLFFVFSSQAVLDSCLTNAGCLMLINKECIRKTNEKNIGVKQSVTFCEYLMAKGGVENVTGKLHKNRERPREKIQISV